MIMRKKIDDDFKYIPIEDVGSYFHTYDFDFAVTLICKECNLVTIDTEQGGRLAFIFQDTPQIKEIFDGFWANKISVDPLEFTNIRKNLKSRIYGMKKGY
jgi:hypothetical protein